MGRPATELIVLEPFQRQMFVLLHIFGWKFPKVTNFFDQLFEEMSKTTGYRMQVPNKQWQGRKEKWEKQWNIGKNRSVNEISAELAYLPLWYDGTTDIISLPPQSGETTPGPILWCYPCDIDEQDGIGGSVLSHDHSVHDKSGFSLGSDNIIATGQSQWQSEHAQRSTGFPNQMPLPNPNTFEMLYTFGLPRKTINSNVGTSKAQQILTASPAAASSQGPSTPAAYVPPSELELPSALRSATKITDRSRGKDASFPMDDDAVYRTSARKRTPRSPFYEPASGRRQSPSARAPRAQEKTSSWEHGVL